VSVVVVDYGSGNLRSVAKALARAAAEGSSGASVTVSGEARVLSEAERVVLPGVGAFGDCMAALGARPGLADALREAVIGRRRPFLGICVGMQLMATRGLEHGEFAGLGWLPGDVVRLAPGHGLKVPHMGWNELSIAAAHPLLAGIEDGAHMYFMHGYHLRAADPGAVLANADYGGPVTAMVAVDNLAGVQFHPEKSQAAGLRLLANFLSWTP